MNSLIAFARLAGELLGARIDLDEFLEGDELDPIRALIIGQVEDMRDDLALSVLNADEIKAACEAYEDGLTFAFRNDRSDLVDKLRKMNVSEDVIALWE